MICKITRTVNVKYTILGLLTALLFVLYIIKAEKRRFSALSFLQFCIKMDKIIGIRYRYRCAPVCFRVLIS